MLSIDGETMYRHYLGQTFYITESAFTYLGSLAMIFYALLQGQVNTQIPVLCLFRWEAVTRSIELFSRANFEPRLKSSGPLNKTLIWMNKHKLSTFC
jgi:hypothetical protein